jgi:phenylalanyl-tRNA synthetase alpha chain
MRDDIQNIKNEALAQIMEAKSQAELEELRIAYLGRNGKLNEVMKGIKDLDANEKRDVGQTMNEVKKAIEQELTYRKNNIKDDKSEWFDPSIPGIPYKVGHYHPTTHVISEMAEIFNHLGFSMYEGPEIESDVWNFEKLNLPKDHPARSLQDALYIEEPDVVLRTHTSSVETRALATLKPPFRIVVAGKCYRFENVNATNNAMFYQFQGVALQKGLSMADLKGTLFYFAKKIFGEDRKLRFRCKFYPEVEPGVGLDIDCSFCGGKGCTVCKGRGWIEMLGAGMIHPNILRNMGHDPKEISGFAFGMGLDRIVMDRFKINDIRSLYNGDIKY